MEIKLILAIEAQSGKMENKSRERVLERSYRCSKFISDPLYVLKLLTARDN